jgi:flagellar basal-body rod protein FlgB
MSDPIINDSAIRAARFALDGLALQQELIGNNLANVDTPGYQAQTVDFQTTLKRALNGSDHEPVRMSLTNAGHLQAEVRSSQSPQTLLRTGGSRRADGNNVDVEVEMSQMAETGIAYQAITQLVSKKLLLMKNIADRR